VLLGQVNAVAPVRGQPTRKGALRMGRWLLCGHIKGMHAYAHAFSNCMCSYARAYGL